MFTRVWQLQVFRVFLLYKIWREDCDFSDDSQSVFGCISQLTPRHSRSLISKTVQVTFTLATEIK